MKKRAKILDRLAPLFPLHALTLSQKLQRSKESQEIEGSGQWQSEEKHHSWIRGFTFSQRRQRREERKVKEGSGQWQWAEKHHS